jgi:hypothetical protein
MHTKKDSARLLLHALGVALLLAACGPVDDLEGIDTDTGEGTRGKADTAGLATYKVLSTGTGWKEMAVSGTMKDEETNTYKTLTNDKVYVVAGAQGIAGAPLPAMIKAELSADLNQSLSIGELKSADEAVYFVHKETAEQVAAGTLVPPPQEGVKVQPLCGDYDKTVQKSVGFDKPLNYSKTFSGTSYSGSLSLSGSVKGSATGKALLRIKRSWCVPYWAKLKNVRVTGVLDAEARVTSSGSFSKQWSWSKQIAKYGVGSFDTLIGPLWVHIGVNVPIDLGLEASAQATAQLDGTVVANGSFDVLCTTGGCSGSKSFTHSYTSHGQPTISLNGRAKVKPWIQGAVRVYLYSDSMAYGQVGVKPYLEGDLWAYTGNSCGDADHNGTNEYVNALTLDGDVGIDVTAKVYVIAVVNKNWSWPVGRWHVGFWDLLPGGSSAVRPIFYRTSSSTGATFRGRMRPCWPYTSPVQYSINWKDGTTTNFTAAPTTLFSKSHSWSGLLPLTVTLTAKKDNHGRSINKSTNASIFSLPALPIASYQPAAP